MRINNTTNWALAKVKPSDIWEIAQSAGHKVLEKFFDDNSIHKTQEINADIILTQFHIEINLDNLNSNNVGFKFIEFLKRNNIGSNLTETKYHFMFDEIFDKKYFILDGDDGIEARRDAVRAFAKILNSYGIESGWSF